jgi:hypothetical protein
VGVRAGWAKLQKKDTKTLGDVNNNYTIYEHRIKKADQYCTVYLSRLML